jgi:5'-nucleotidase
VHERGDLTFRDVIDMLPYMDEIAIVAMPGHRLLRVLENGVSMFPKTEGRWIQVRVR